MKLELRALIEPLGEIITLKIVEEYHGLRLFVPKVVPVPHKLREILDDVELERLLRYFGGSVIAVPIARSW